MKNIRSKFILIFIFIVSISCSKSDVHVTSRDPIVGRWKYQARFINDIETSTADCAPGIIEFSYDGKRTERRFDRIGANDCVERILYTRWQKYSTDYRITDAAGVLLGISIEFENNNRVMTSTTVTIDEDPQNPGFIYTKLVYTKL